MSGIVDIKKKGTKNREVFGAFFCFGIQARKEKKEFIYLGG